MAMKALVMTLQGNPVGARQLISKAIHSSPEDADLWKAMAIHLLNYHRYVDYIFFKGKSPRVPFHRITSKYSELKKGDPC